MNMDQRIPKHHLKQEICATRPAYREGRIPKAVKVYTINNESKYILIQGVPSVGAMKELIKLCSSYGQVEEHHSLDEYPCEDQYTEVYLVKYKKIQSARFAKRKLDEYSFFGGNLHVCYAPEYETVTETREKLKDRRRVVAAKIRCHKSEGHNTKTTEQVIQHNEYDTPSSTRENKTLGEANLQSSSSSSFQYNPGVVDTNTKDIHASLPDSSHSQSSSIESDNSSLNVSHAPYSFVLPPPPKPSTVNKHIETRPKYEYSRVPSKHSTLPINFDGRLQPLSDQSVATSQSQSESSQSETTISKNSVNIRKDYTPIKQALRFVPRQAVKRKSDESGPDSHNNASTSDDVDKKIRKNAFVLGDQQGPTDLPGRITKAPEVTPGASKSYTATIKTIRSKISQVITDSLMQKK